MGLIEQRKKKTNRQKKTPFIPLQMFFDDFSCTHKMVANTDVWVLCSKLLPQSQQQQYKKNKVSANISKLLPKKCVHPPIDILLPSQCPVLAH